MKNYKNYEKIIDRLYEFSTGEIVQKAWEGLIPGFCDGWCVYDIEADELISVSLNQNEIIAGGNMVYLYKIPANVYGDSVWNIKGDILSEEEFEKYEELGYDDVEKFLAEHTDDTFDDRFFDFLVWCAEEEFDLEKVIKEHFESV